MSIAVEQERSLLTANNLREDIVPLISGEGKTPDALFLSGGLS
jgi:hypothetical protein